MLPPRPIPQPLKIVAYLFIIGGVLSVLDVVLSLLNGKIKIDFGVLGIFIENFGFKTPSFDRLRNTFQDGFTRGTGKCKA